MDESLAGALSLPKASHWRSTGLGEETQSRLAQKRGDPNTRPLELEQIQPSLAAPPFSYL